MGGTEHDLELVSQCCCAALPSVLISPLLVSVGETTKAWLQEVNPLSFLALFKPSNDTVIAVRVYFTVCYLSEQPKCSTCKP